MLNSSIFNSFVLLFLFCPEEMSPFIFKIIFKNFNFIVPSGPDLFDFSEERYSLLQSIRILKTNVSFSPCSVWQRKPTYLWLFVSLYFPTVVGFTVFVFIKHFPMSGSNLSALDSSQKLSGIAHNCLWNGQTLGVCFENLLWPSLFEGKQS